MSRWTARLALLASFVALGAAPAEECPPLYQQATKTLPGKPRGAEEIALVEHVDKSIKRANALESKVSPDVLNIQGMSSPKIRHLLNNLASRPRTRYLEIGLWKGSTFISTLFGNEKNVVEATGIENWSEFNGPEARTSFKASSAKLLKEGSFTLREEDCFKTDRTAFRQKASMYLYDGDHSKEAQKRAFTYFDAVLDSPLIVLVDDWNACPERQGTYDAFIDLGYTVIHERFLTKADGWWEGFYVAVVRREPPVPGKAPKEAPAAKDAPAPKEAPAPKPPPKAP